jgi:predicted nucleotidyltransferase
MGYLKLIREQEEKRETLRKEALEEAKKLGRLLRENFEFETLFLIGSVLKEKHFTRYSDIDFVIKGLKSEMFFKVLAFLMSNSIFDVDLKPYEELDEDSKLKIEKEGLILE